MFPGYLNTRSLFPTPREKWPLSFVPLSSRLDLCLILLILFWPHLETNSGWRLDFSSTSLPSPIDPLLFAFWKGDLFALNFDSTLLLFPAECSCHSVLVLIYCRGQVLTCHKMHLRGHPFHFHTIESRREHLKPIWYTCQLFYSYPLQIWLQV